MAVLPHYTITGITLALASAAKTAAHARLTSDSSSNVAAGSVSLEGQHAL